MRVNNVAGYVLKRQDYGDTSLLVDVFTREYGRLKVIVKGARSGRSEKSRMLQPFAHLTLGWSGKSDLKTLTQLESNSTFQLEKEPLVCAFYLNELIWNFLEVQDPHEQLFDRYQEVLDSFSQGEALEPLLRDFEFFLLQDVGYGVSFDIDSDTGEYLSGSGNYRYELEKGVVSVSNENEGVSGELFLALANRDFSEQRVLGLAKSLTRQIINHRLDGRELYSRKWFADLKRASG